MRYAVRSFVLVVHFIFAACQNPPSSETVNRAGDLESAVAPRNWNVLVLVPDTFRGDRISANGYKRKTTPHLDAIAADGINFRNAVTVAPRTWQSFSSILTGLYPPGHGVRSIFGGKIPGTVPMLAPYLRESGYATAAFDPINFLSGMTEKGAFDAYITPGKSRKPGETGDEAVLRELEKFMLTKREQPFLAFVRLGGAHWPYTDRSFMTQEHDCADYPHTFNQGTYGTKLGKGGLQIRNEEAFRKMIWSPDDSERIRQHRIAHYDSEVHRTDELIGRLVQKMRQNGVLENTIVAITSDHGESFGGHGYMQHGPRVDESVMHVPLIIWLPPGHGDRRPGTVVDAQVRVIDLFPTLVDAIGLQPPPGVDGRSLLTKPGAKSVSSTPIAYGETGRSFMGIDPERYLEGVAGKHRMVRTDRWKLLYIPDPVGGKRLLFDILADPGEQKDLAAEHPEIVEKLFAELEKVDGSGLGGGADRSLTQSQIDRLRQLGYVQ
jgi:arylsulfatase A-like enzyme